MDLEEAFALVVRRKRAELRISQEDLADRSNLDRTYISALERGLYMPSLKTCFALAKAFGDAPHAFVLEVEEAAKRRAKR